MRFGMPTLIEIDNLEETIKLCKKLGLDFIELNMNLPDYQINELEKTSKFLELKNKYKINYTIHLDENLNVCDFNTEVAQAYFSTVKKSIAVAKAINAPILNMHINHGVHFTLPNKKVELFELYFQQYFNSWKKFRTMCESEIADSNIKICIENTNGFRDYEKTAINYLLESNVFALTWDIGHSNSTKNIDEPFITEHISKLKHFHIHDSLNSKDHLTLGSGEIDLHKRLNLANENNCSCVIETKTVSALIKSVEWLKNYKYI